MMYSSNLESLRHKPAKSLQDRRIAYLENQIQQLKEYRKRARSSKLSVIIGLITRYEQKIESIYSSLYK